jgi:hypothetical protein
LGSRARRGDRPGGAARRCRPRARVHRRLRGVQRLLGAHVSVRSRRAVRQGKSADSFAPLGPGAGSRATRCPTPASSASG